MANGRGSCSLAIVKNADKTSGGICNVSGMWGTCMDSTLSGSDSWLPEKMLTYICTVNRGVSIAPCLFHCLVPPVILLLAMLAGGACHTNVALI